MPWRGLLPWICLLQLCSAVAPAWRQVSKQYILNFRTRQYLDKSQLKRDSFWLRTGYKGSHKVRSTRQLVTWHPQLGNREQQMLIDKDLCSFLFSSGPNPGYEANNV